MLRRTTIGFPSMLVVKKYANRRLYDTSESRYITLDDLADRIRRGSDVQVLDAHTSEDLTQAILTQIILESRGGARLLPVKLLTRLIRMEDEALAEFFGRYVSWALEAYVNARQGARSLLPLNPLATAPFAATDALARLVLGATPWMRSPEPGTSAVSSPAGRADEPPPMPPMPIPATDRNWRPEPVEPDAQGGRAARRQAVETSDADASRLAHDVGEQMARLRAEIEALKRSVAPAATKRKRPAKRAKAR
jgi:polyhydroxyalkanoate synthesis repressor PhaR